MIYSVYVYVRRVPDECKCNIQVCVSAVSTSCKQGTVSKLVLRGCDETDGQTDGRTPDSCIAPAPHTMRAVRAPPTILYASSSHQRDIVVKDKNNSEKYRQSQRDPRDGLPPARRAVVSTQQW